MSIACPQCSATFSDVSGLAGKRVRCTKCGEKFWLPVEPRPNDSFAFLESESIVATPKKVAGPNPSTRRPAAPATMRKRGWLLLLLVVAVAGIGLSGVAWVMGIRPALVVVDVGQGAGPILGRATPVGKWETISADDSQNVFRVTYRSDGTFEVPAARGAFMDWGTEDGIVGTWKIRQVGDSYKLTHASDFGNGPRTKEATVSASGSEMHWDFEWEGRDKWIRLGRTD